MTKIDVFSGFLGAGKTTLIKKLIKEAYAGEKLVLIENEFGEIGIDGGFMKEAGIQVTEMNSGCICCSLTGDFRAAMHEVVDRFAPDRILIEPSGVGKLSDIVSAVEQVEGAELVINALGTVVDAAKAKMYMRNFGEFFNNQVESAGCIILSRTGGMAPEKIAQCVALLREKNPGAVIITTPWEELTGAQILSALERRDTLAAALETIQREHEEEEEEEHDHDEHGHHHHHDHHDHDDDDDDHDEHEHHHHHHDHDHHDHEHHHHGHDADEIFTSWGMETAKKFTEAELREKLAALEDQSVYGSVLRAKGIVDADEGGWFHFDYTPGEIEIRRGSAEITGRLCVIGAELKEEAVAALFGA
jgi:G3E family GTPase